LPEEQPPILGTNDRLIHLATKPNPGPPTKPKEALDEAILHAVPAKDERQTRLDCFDGGSSI